jgi:hypothetical protein
VAPWATQYDATFLGYSVGDKLPGPLRLWFALRWTSKMIIYCKSLNLGSAVNVWWLNCIENQCHCLLSTWSIQKPPQWAPPRGTHTQYETDEPAIQISGGLIAFFHALKYSQISTSLAVLFTRPSFSNDCSTRNHCLIYRTLDSHLPIGFIYVWQVLPGSCICPVHGFSGKMSVRLPIL